MAWRYTKAGRPMSRPCSENGIHVDGPLTVDDWKAIIEDVAEEMCEQAVREAMEKKDGH